MKTIERKYLRRKILAIKTGFFAVVGVKRTNGEKFHYAFRLVLQDKKLPGKKIILAKKIVSRRPRGLRAEGGKQAEYRLIAIEGVKRIKTKGCWYRVIND